MRHTPHTVTRTRSSPGPGSGTGRSTNAIGPESIGPGRRTTHAFMAGSTQLLQQIHPLDEMTVAEELVADPPSRPGAEARRLPR